MAERATIFKTFLPDSIGVNEEQRKAAFTVSTGDVDRDGDTVDPLGWDLDAYRKNPVILWSHQTKEPPIARSERIWVEDGKLKSIAAWPEPGIHPFADTIYGLVKGGFIRGTSVGFFPLEAEPRAGAAKGVAYKRHELYEYSILPIPSNREALAEAKSAGLDIAPVVEWCEAFLEGSANAGIWLPRTPIEKALMALTSRVAVPALPPGWATGAEGHAKAGAALPIQIEIKRGDGDFYGNQHSEPKGSYRGAERRRTKDRRANSDRRTGPASRMMAAGEESVRKFIKEEGGQFCVHSEAGKNLGCYDTKAEAAKRLGQIEYFKREGKGVEMETVVEMETEAIIKAFGDALAAPPAEAPAEKPPAGEKPAAEAGAGTGNPKIDAAYNALWPEVIAAVKAGDPVAVANALKMALEKFAAEVMAQMGGPAAGAQADETSPNAAPPAAGEYPGKGATEYESFLAVLTAPDDNVVKAMAEMGGLDNAAVRAIFKTAAAETLREEHRRLTGRLPD